MTRATILALCTVSFAFPQDFTGEWVASWRIPGSSRQIVLNLAHDRQGAWACSFGASPCASLVVNGARLSFVVAEGRFRGSFTGKLSADGKSIAGILLRDTGHLALDFERIGRAPEATPSPAAATAPAADSAGVLERALKKLSGTQSRLVRYTCLETVERSHYAVPATRTGANVMSEAPSSCSGRKFGAGGPLHLTFEDRLRLAVAVADGKEINSWASASGFDSRSISDLVSNGPTSTGAFGTLLVSVFENPNAQYQFAGQRSEDGRTLYTYTFDVPLEASSYHVATGSGWQKTAYHGSFDVVATTGELVRLMSETAELPDGSHACRYRTAANYHEVPIGGGQYLIPLESAFDDVFADGSEDHSALAFSTCHEYSAESSLTFGGAALPGGARTGPKTGQALPAGLSLTLALAAAIDTRTAAAGDAVTARVTKAVRAPGSDQILVSAGAIAHGRILEMRRQIDAAQFVIAIRYDTLEQNGSMAPLEVVAERELKAEHAPVKGRLLTRGAEFALPAQAASADAGSWFTLPASSGRAVMPAGSESKWTTVAQ